MKHTQQQTELTMHRRQFLGQAGISAGALALSSLLADESHGTAPTGSALAIPKRPHFAPRAKNVIFLFMCGGASQIETFDYKPTLKNYAGQRAGDLFTAKELDGFNPEKSPAKTLILPSVFEFQRHGQSGAWVSEIFPRLTQVVDDICFIKSMHTEGVAHGPSTLFLHTGATNLIRPSVGSWVTYGLGTENQNLPGFVTLQPSGSKGGPRNHSNAFLPAIFQGTSIGKAGQPASEATLRNAVNTSLPLAEQERRFRLLRKLNAAQLANRPEDDQLEAVAESFELAWRMQMNAPEVFDLAGEDESTKRLYGIGEKHTDDFGKQCLMARRMAEAGVRYIQVNYADESTNPRWDQHSNMPKHMDHARATDKPVAGLLADLKRRGLLEETLVWWGGEFGRTPIAQGRNGRDHNPQGFSMWMAGGGVKRGHTHGETDEYGYYAVQDKVHMHDLHATILYQLGLNHEKLTYRYAGRDFRLTDVYGRVVEEILA